MKTDSSAMKRPAPNSCDQRPHVVVVGAGFGGLEAAQKLKTAPVRVTVVERRNHHLFQPLLYQVATAGLAATDIAVPVRSVLRDHDNVRVLMDEATAIDVDAQILRTTGTTLKYDFLIVATGSEYSYFGHDEWREAAPGLKSIDDAAAIRRKILIAFERAEMAGSEAEQQRLLTFVLIGAGPTGVEMAGAIAELANRVLARDFRVIDPSSAHIVLVEAGPTVLPSFPAPLAAYTRQRLADKGVDVRLDTSVTDVRTDGVLAGGEWIASDTIIWCAGVRATPLVRDLDGQLDGAGRVEVAPNLSLPSAPEVFVIGDAARTLSEDGTPLPGLAPVAKQQGAFVADLITRRVVGERASKSFRYSDRGTMATIGRSVAVADLGWLSLTGWIAWSLVHIYFLIGFRNRVMVFIDWAWAYVTFGRGARLISGQARGGRRSPSVRRPHQADAD